MQQRSISLWEWLVPMAFFFCISWVVWQLPAFILDWIPPANESLFGQIDAIFTNYDIIRLPSLFGGHIDILDMLALLLLPVLFVLGVRTVKRSSIESENWAPVDRASVFLGRVTMMMIIVLTCVMLYEVFVRYALERPTLWANETTLWIASFVFLLAGLYAMQQRSHIRIVLLYDAMPRNLQRAFDVASTFLIIVFAAATVFGSYKFVFVNKLYRWELYGSAFNPPIPATLQPMIIIIITLVALQAVANLITDWNRTPEDMRTPEVDLEEVEAIKKSLGAK
ncbi:MAG: TRAP transporter small permease subunit [Aliishimia sp.]